MIASRSIGSLKQACINLLVYPVGTTDFSLDNTDASSTQGLADNGRNQLIFTAPRTGVMPLAFRVESLRDAGPYAFTAYVRHAVRLSLPRVSRLRRKATLRVSARNAEGGVINDPALRVDVRIKRGKAWRKVGSAPVVNSVASVKLNVPARFSGRKVSLCASAHGNGYINAASRTLWPRVAGKAKR